MERLKFYLNSIVSTDEIDAFLILFFNTLILTTHVVVERLKIYLNSIVSTDETDAFLILVFNTLNTLILNNYILFWIFGSIKRFRRMLYW